MSLIFSALASFGVLFTPFYGGNMDLNTVMLFWIFFVLAIFVFSRG